MKAIVNGESVDLCNSECDIESFGDRLLVKSAGVTRSAVVVSTGVAAHVSYGGRTYIVERRARSRAGHSHTTGEIHAPMPGAIVDVLVEAGQTVDKGDKLVVLEAMKTQQAFVAPYDGVVERVGVAKGSQVKEGDLLVRVAEKVSP